MRCKVTILTMTMAAIGPCQLSRSIFFLARNLQRITLQTKRSFSEGIEANHSYREQATTKWLESIVIGQKLCPFAPPVRKAPQLRIHISNAKDHNSIVDDIKAEVHLLVGPSTHEEGKDAPSKPETTLVVLNEHKCPSLSNFNDLVKLSWRAQTEAIVEYGYQQDLQLVLFHPQAKHDTYSELEDAADYTIRSPFPMFHLLREKHVMKAVKSGFQDLKGLPARNKARLRADGWDVCAARLEACLHRDK